MMNDARTDETQTSAGCTHTRQDEGEMKTFINVLGCRQERCEESETSTMHQVDSSDQQVSYVCYDSITVEIDDSMPGKIDGGSMIAKLRDFRGTLIGREPKVL